MPLTPETLPRHELVGLQAAVVKATSEAYVGIAGRVVEETTKTLRLAAGGRAWSVPKRAATFEFALPDDGEDDGTYATVEGKRLVARPARRTETGGGTLWHSD